MISKLDIHVLVMPGEPTSELVNSIQPLDYVTTHIVDGVKDHLGKGRSAGFALGNSPFVTYADPDDIILTEHIEEMILFLENNPNVSGVCPMEFCQAADGTRKVRKDRRFPKHKTELSPAQCVRVPHHLTIYRRTDIEKYLGDLKEWCNWSDFALLAKMSLDGHKFVFFERLCYVWSVRPDGAHRTLPPCPKATEIIRTAWCFKPQPGEPLNVNTLS